MERYKSIMCEVFWLVVLVALAVGHVGWNHGWLYGAASFWFVVFGWGLGFWLDRKLLK